MVLCRASVLPVQNRSKCGLIMNQEDKDDQGFKRVCGKIVDACILNILQQESACSGDVGSYSVVFIRGKQEATNTR